METIEITIRLPEEISKHIPDLSKYTYEKLVLGLYLDGEVSLGRAAKMLSMPYDQFICYLGQHKIPYFQASPADIQKELNQLSGI